MHIRLTREFLTSRIDRCYLIAAGAKRPEKRQLHLEMARHYRNLLNVVLQAPAIRRA